MPSSLPPELLDCVFGHLDTGLLQPCALVCHAWKTLSQRHTFRAISIETLKRWNRLANLLSTSHHIRPLIKQLHICLTIFTTDPLRLSHLHSLHVFFPEVIHLELTSMIDLALLRDFPKLKTLILSSVALRTSSPSGVRLPITLTSLTFTPMIDSISPLFTEWIDATATASAESLQDLTLGFGMHSYTSDRPYSLIAQFLSSHPRLRSLTLKLAASRDRSATIDTALGVVLVPHLRIHANAYDLAVADVFSVLKLSTFPRLSSLEIAFNGNTEMDPPYPPLPDANINTLVIPRGLASRLVTVNLILPHNMPAGNRDIIIGLFGEVNRRGVLTLHFVPPT